MSLSDIAKSALNSDVAKDLISAGIEILPEIVNPAPRAESFTDKYINTRMAAEFGDYEDASEWVKDLDDELASVSFFAIKSIKENHAYEWENCISALNNSDGIVAVPDSHKSKVGEYTNSSTDVFKVDGSPNETIVKQLESLFKDTCDAVDASIFTNSALVEADVPNRLAKIAAQTGARISNFEKLFYASADHSEKVLEISIVRFPDKEYPHIRLFRITVEAWYSCKRVGPVETNNNGFIVDVNGMQFKLNDAIKNVIESKHVTKFKEKLSEPSLFDF